MSPDTSATGGAPTTTGTREHLIVAAERLFAERGVGAVSLREIGAAAGQRNTAAAQYHFGSKEALIEAIFDLRMRTINAHRMELLARAQADGRTGDLRAMIEAFVHPLAVGIATRDTYYGRFMAQLYAIPRYRSPFDWDNAASLRLVWRGIARCLDDLPRAVLSTRLRLLSHMTVHTMADQEAAPADETARAPAPDTPHEPPQWAVDLVDAATGMLTAPCHARRDRATP